MTPKGGAPLSSRVLLEGQGRRVLAPQIVQEGAKEAVEDVEKMQLERELRRKQLELRAFAGQG